MATLTRDEIIAREEETMKTKENITITFGEVSDISYCNKIKEYNVICSDGRIRKVTIICEVTVPNGNNIKK